MSLRALPDVLAVQIFSFLPDKDLARIACASPKMHNNCAAAAFQRLKKEGCVVPNNQLALQGLRKIDEIKSSFPAALINGIGGAHHIFNAQKLQITNMFCCNDALGFFTTAHLTGPITWGKDLLSNSFLSFHIQSKNNPEAIYTYNICQSLLQGFDGIYMAPPNMVEILPPTLEGTPFRPQRQNAENPAILATIKQIFNNTHLTQKLYTSPVQALHPDLVSTLFEVPQLEQLPSNKPGLYGLELL